MKPLPVLPQVGSADDDGAFGEADERELLEGFEGTSVHEKLVDADFFNRFEDDFDEEDMALP
jgi:hypothetical protein